MTQEKTLARLQWEQAVENEDFDSVGHTPG